MIGLFSGKQCCRGNTYKRFPQTSLKKCKKLCTEDKNCKHMDHTSKWSFCGLCNTDCDYAGSVKLSGTTKHYDTYINSAHKSLEPFTTENDNEESMDIDTNWRNALTRVKDDEIAAIERTKMYTDYDKNDFNLRYWQGYPKPRFNVDPKDAAEHYKGAPLHIRKMAGDAVNMVQNRQKVLKSELNTSYNGLNKGLYALVEDQVDAINKIHDENKISIKNFQAAKKDMNLLKDIDLPNALRLNDLAHSELREHKYNEGFESRPSALRKRMLQIKDIEYETFKLDEELKKSNVTAQTTERKVELHEPHAINYERINYMLWYVYYVSFVVFVAVVYLLNMTLGRKIVYVAIALVFPYLFRFIQIRLGDAYHMVSSIIHGIPFDK